jgi:hypothetical protein
MASRSRRLTSRVVKTAAAPRAVTAHVKQVAKSACRIGCVPLRIASIEPHSIDRL